MNPPCRTVAVGLPSHLMKSTFTSLLGTLSVASLLLAATPVLAQSNGRPPTQLTYQGFLTDGTGTPFGSATPVNKTIVFRIYDAASGGNLKWSSQQVVTVDKGYFSVLLGQGSANGNEPFSADLTGVFTGSATVSDRYLELTADGTTILPRVRFFAAPYSMLAKSATELVDPVSGTSAFSISGGNISGSGNLSAGALNAASLSVTGGMTAGGGIASSGALSAASVTVTGAVTAGGLATGVGLLSTGNLQTHSQGAYLEWNKEVGSGMSYLLNQKGLGAGGWVVGEVSTANAITERLRIDSAGQVGIGTSSPGARLDVNGTLRAGAATLDSVTANSFKISGTTTLVLTSITRAAMATATPMAGVSQSSPNTGTGRASTPPSDWWKSTSSSGTLMYTGTFTVPAGETWEVSYSCNYYWGTDDTGGVVWSVDDVAPDDQVILGQQGSGNTGCNQTFILSPGTHYVRVKAVLYGGSGTDAIYFPGNGAAHLVVRKYRAN